MINVKTIISVIAIILTFVGYVPYLRDTIKGKTKPHVYSWFIWGLLTGIIFLLQFSAGAGAGSWVTFAVTLVSFSIFLLGMRIGKKDITRLDTICLGLSLFALLLWVIAKQPIWSVILLVLIEMFGFIPTVRKSWNKPFSETLFTYELNIFRHGLSLFALQQYSLVTWLYPAAWTLANLLFSFLLIMRRRHIKK